MTDKRAAEVKAAKATSAELLSLWAFMQRMAAG